MKKIFLSILLFLTLFLSASFAQEKAQSSFLPNIPKASGKPHPEGNEFMRKYHMDLLKHDRDLTVKNGVRDIDDSLAQCVTCHEVKDENNKPVTYESEEYFCRVCHDYVAVKIDCFSCHNSVPDESVPDETKKTSSIFPLKKDNISVLLSYLEEGKDEQ